MGVTCQRLGKTRQFFAEKRPLDIALRQFTPFRETLILKITKNRFFSEVGRSSRDMVSIFRDPQCATWVHKDEPPILDSRGIQRRHAKLEPTTNYQLQKIDIF